ncbi:hypothetical protein K458DRAFT_124133 [Lentithecium fluviatile CBS 122367]|uniref:Uncharacterized protein n=1 Tax=Lentithecium fluviatile CBS 122367 TaxID=1168545 RepID=A0A6G1JFY4_9PLEO|nr:hypothetical protein K458DRAFT_124133 [Lentithecium fluviatile CBS 122367]
MQNFFEAKSIPHHSVLVRRLYGEDAPPLLGLGRLDPSEPTRNKLELELPPEDGAVAPILKFTSQRESLISVAEPKEPKLKIRRVSAVTLSPVGTESPVPPAKNKHDPKLTIHKPPADAPSPAEKTPILIRYTTPKAPPFIRYTTHPDEVDYCADKLRQGQKMVQRLTDEYRTTMHDIMRSNKQPMDLGVKRVREDSPSAIRARTRKTRIYINELANKADSIDANLYGLQKVFQKILESATQNVFDSLLTRIQQITASITGLRNDFAHLLNFIILRTRLIHYTNNSAVTIYQLNVSLRWRLGAMILTRQQHKHPHPMARSIPPLEQKLVKLRAYGSSLFYERKGLSVPYVRQRLIEMEGQNFILRNLILSRPAERRQRIAALPLAQQIENNRNADLRRVIKSDGLKGNEKIRRTFDSLKPRFESTVNPVLRRVAVSPPDQPLVRIYPSVPRLVPRQRIILRRRVHQRRIRRPHRRTIDSEKNLRFVGARLFARSVFSSRSKKRRTGFGGRSVPIDERERGVRFRKYVSPARKEKIEAQRTFVKRQTERKRMAKRALVDTVKGWLGAGTEDESSNKESTARVFGSGGGGVSLSAIPVPDVGSGGEVQMEGAYGVGLERRVPSDGDALLDALNGRSAPSQNRHTGDPTPTDANRSAGFLPGQRGGDPFVFPAKDSKSRRR